MGVLIDKSGYKNAFLAEEIKDFYLGKIMKNRLLVAVFTKSLLN